MYMRKYEDVMLYLFFGVMSTIVNIVVYYVLTRFFYFNISIATIFAWVFAVIFAFVTNKFFVFKSNIKELINVFKEFILFSSCRLISLVVEIILMNCVVNVFYMNDVIAKTLINIIVIVLNYLFSKLFIFKNK